MIKLVDILSGKYRLATKQEVEILGRAYGAWTRDYIKSALNSGKQLFLSTDTSSHPSIYAVYVPDFLLSIKLCSKKGVIKYD